MKLIKILLTIVFFISANAYSSENFQKIDVIKVYDGDTVKSQFPQGVVNIRLVGIDCYETSKIHRAYTQAYQNNISIEEVILRGTEARKILKKIISDNDKNIYFDFQGIDNYGRALGILYVKDKNINKMMEDTGLCPVYNYKKKKYMSF